jgi:hypothetical protein
MAKARRRSTGSRLTRGSFPVGECPTASAELVRTDPPNDPRMGHNQSQLWIITGDLVAPTLDPIRKYKRL